MRLKMIHIIMLLICTFLLAVATVSCCDSNLGCCGPPPDPFLIEDVYEWMEPYKNGSSKIYQNQDMENDTLTVDYEESTEFCGGDECSNDCEVIHVTLSSSRYPGFNFLIVGRLNDNITTSYNQPDSSEARVFNTYINFPVEQYGPLVFEPELELVITPDFLIKDEEVYAVEVTCNQQLANCYNYYIKSLLISREYGILAFTDQNDDVWRLVFD